MIVGLDVGRAGVVAAALEQFPVNPKRYFTQHRREFVRLSANRDGIEYLKLLRPAGLVMEPTGVWYSALWRDFARSVSIPVYWVSHADLAAVRASYGFKNKRDDEDAFCLAAMYFDSRFVNQFGSKRFLTFEAGPVQSIHSCFLALEQLDKNRSAMVCQARQRLALEFPEVCHRESKTNEELGFSPFWGWLAGLHTYTRIENDYRNSVAPELGIEISEYTRDHALAICQLELRQFKTELHLSELINSPQFWPYLKVFKKFGFGLRNQALLLSLIYPFEKFLLDGRPWVEWEAGADGKPQKRHRSLRAFQSYLGLSYSLKQSGDKLQKKFGGSDICRSHLYMWAVDRICLDNPQRLKTEVGQILGAKYDALRKWEYKEGRRLAGTDAIPGRDSIMRVLFKATALLFKELCRELIGS